MADIQDGKVRDDVAGCERSASDLWQTLQGRKKSSPFCGRMNFPSNFAPVPPRFSPILGLILWGVKRALLV